MKTIERIFKDKVRVFYAMTTTIGVTIRDEIGERPWLAMRPPMDDSDPGPILKLNLLPSPGPGYDGMDYIVTTNIVIATDITGGKALLLAKVDDDLAVERWQMLVRELERLGALEPETAEREKPGRKRNELYDIAYKKIANGELQDDVFEEWYWPKVKPDPIGKKAVRKNFDSAMNYRRKMAEN